MTIAISNRPLHRAVLLAAALCAGLRATPILTPGPFNGTYDIVAQARNGRTGWEAALFTPDNFPAYMNPYGVPAWSYGQPYSFQFLYLYASGTTSWSIDFNRDADYLDSHESVTRISPSLAGLSFRYLNLFLQGTNQRNSLITATVQNLTINGVRFGPYSGDNGAFQVLFTDTGGLFGDVLVRGELIFSANGGSDERPRMWLRLGSAELYQDPLSAVPEPGSLASMAAGLALIALRTLRRTGRRES